MSSVWDQDDLDDRYDRAFAAFDEGDEVESRAIAEALVAEHLEDPPEDAVEVVMATALLLAMLRENAGETQAALALLGRLVERYDRPEVPDDRIAEAMVRHAALLHDTGREEASVARCRAVVERFGGDDDPHVAEQVDWARRGIGYDWAVQGHRAHGRVGRAAEAESLFRRAIVAGNEPAWLGLAIVLAEIPGREDEEEDALRTALEVDDDETVSLAAVRLGRLRHWRHRDPDAARPLYELAVERGDEDTAAFASLQLGWLAAFEGDRDGAVTRIHASLRRSYGRWNMEVTEDDGRGGAAFLTALAAGRRTRRAWRRWLWATDAFGRWCRRVRASSPPARAIGRLRG